MPNHWHFVLQPTEAGGMGDFLRWATLAQTMRYHSHCHTAGEGHVYQGRFKSFPVQDDGHFHVLRRDVERNALRAKLVMYAKNWRRGSPFGQSNWVESIARRLDLESTLRPRGRPKKKPIPTDPPEDESLTPFLYRIDCVQSVQDAKYSLIVTPASLLARLPIQNLPSIVMNDRILGQRRWLTGRLIAFR